MHVAEFAPLSDNLTKALITRDADLYASLMILPLRIEPRGANPYILKTRAELDADFGAYCTALQIANVTDIVREILQSVHIEDDWIEVTVETNILSNVERVVDPFRTQFVLCPKGAAWGISQIRSSLGHINWTLNRAEIDRTKKFRTY